tara:strand:- start:631 stop:1254 length:624 start_codon:yes stop_codon:yes gene_type:complete
MISRGLLISVGVTLLAVGLLFVYFRNKVNGIEKKVELMFNLIQNYEGQQNAIQAQYVPSTQVSMEQQNVSQVRSELIEVSDDEADDSEEVSDSEDEDDNDETLKFDSTNIQLNEEDIKTIQLEELNNDNNDENNKDVQEDSLDDDDSDDEDDEESSEELEPEEVITLTEQDYKKKTVAELKQLASSRGLQNYSSLKKAPLIELLMSQ